VTARRPRAAITARSLARGLLERVETGGAYANRALSAALDRATESIARCRRWLRAGSTGWTRGR
jgi:hypothetical protein